MIVLSGASASGKTEAAKYLQQNYGIPKIITTTTRQKRIGEEDGRDYFFVTIEKFKEMIENQEFVEYTFYNGNYYGSTKNQIQPNRCVVIDPQGMLAYRALDNKDIVIFYLDCDDDTRFERMLLRGDRYEDACVRIKNDKKVFNREVLKLADMVLDSKKHNIEEVAKLIYDNYKLILEQRK